MSKESFEAAFDIGPTETVAQFSRPFDFAGIPATLSAKAVPDGTHYVKLRCRLEIGMQLRTGTKRLPVHTSEVDAIYNVLRSIPDMEEFVSPLADETSNMTCASAVKHIDTVAISRSAKTSAADEAFTEMCDKFTAFETEVKAAKGVYEWTLKQPHPANVLTVANTRASAGLTQYDHAVQEMANAFRPVLAGAMHPELAADVATSVAYKVATRLKSAPPHRKAYRLPARGNYRCAGRKRCTE